MIIRASILPMGTALALLAALPAAVCPITQAASHAIDQREPAEPSGTVEIINVAGSVIVRGWDRPEVAVSGQIGDRVERVDLTRSDHHTVVRVVLPQGIGFHFGGDESAHLTIQVPIHSALEASLVSSSLSVSGVTGSQQLRTVSGDIESDGAAAAHVNTVSGDVHLSTQDAASAQIETMSGDLTVNGAGGDVSINTVSGGGHLKLGTLHSLSLRTVSGDFEIDARLDAAAQVRAESVSGDVKLAFSGSPGAEFDLHSLSGAISNCTGPKATHPEYGPGSRLSFSTGDGKARVQMSSTSGDLTLCAR
jgi:DUF4097 and DUF4098 domain-containing protein YvlB